jgi:sugar lactone lactonase YvrE
LILTLLECGFLIATLIAPGCTDAPSIPGGYVLDVTQSGIPHARNAGTGAWTKTERWDAQVGLTLGRADGKGEDVFGNVHALAVSELGSMFVLDALAQEIKVFDREGKHVRSFGRRGDGPGEFAFADGLTVDREGRVWVVDARHFHVAVFDTMGTFLYAVPRPGLPVSTPWIAEVIEDGVLADWMQLSPGREYTTDFPPVVGDQVLYVPIRLRPPDGAVDTLPAIEYRYPMKGRLRIPMTVRVALAQDPGGDVWFSHPSEYTFYHRDAKGDTLLKVSLEDARPVAITRAGADSIIQAGWSNTPPPRALVPLGGSRPDQLTSADLPPVRPIIDHILIDGAGHVLVVPEIDGLVRGSSLDVFEEATGRYLGRVSLPVPLQSRRPARARPGHLYIVTEGDHEVPLVVRIDLSVPDGKSDAGAPAPPFRP